jgi:hypothetical protein
MMGCQAGSQERLFYAFNLEHHIPDNHLLCGINRFLDLSDLGQHLAGFYSHTRPSIDPELLIRMLIIGYSFGIRSGGSPMRRSPSQSGVPLVLSSGSGRCGAGSFHVLEESAWTLSRERCVSPSAKILAGFLKQRRATKEREYYVR